MLPKNIVRVIFFLFLNELIIKYAKVAISRAFSAFAIVACEDTSNGVVACEDTSNGVVACEDTSNGVGTQARA
jgi:hypothetical protein